MASGHLKTPHQQAEHMAAPTSPCDIVQKTLANSEPSTHAISFRKPLPTRSRPHMRYRSENPCQLGAVHTCDIVQKTLANSEPSTHGPLIATALVASIPDPHVFRSGRDLSAWIGLVPKQSSTGGKERLGSISKAGNRYLRRLLFVGALSVIKRAKQLGYTRHPWLVRLMERRSRCFGSRSLPSPWPTRLPGSPGR